MDQVLQSIDSDLTDLEENLLEELSRLLKLESTDTYCRLKPDRKGELRLILEALEDALEHSGDRANLSLKTTDHEILQTRMAVVDNLTSRNIPMAFVEVTLKEAEAERTELEFEVNNYRNELKRNGMPIPRDETALSLWEAARNPERITRAEESQFAEISQFADKGLFSASRELAVLNQQVALHHEDDQSIEEVLKARAEFNSKDLSRGHAQDAKGSANIAQSPEEIRSKLAGRDASEPVGKAVFGAKDIPALSEVVGTKTEEKKEEPRPTGKAVFESKDLSDPKP